MRTEFDYKISLTPNCSSELEIGEMMEIVTNNNTRHIIMRVYNAYLSLNDPNSTWSLDVDFKGRKLLKGETIKLIQE